MANHSRFSVLSARERVEPIDRARTVPNGCPTEVLVVRSKSLTKSVVRMRADPQLAPRNERICIDAVPVEGARLASSPEIGPGDLWRADAPVFGLDRDRVDAKVPALQDRAVAPPHAPDA
jgi:hypothetical protein